MVICHLKITIHPITNIFAAVTMKGLSGADPAPFSHAGTHP
jgi:hypothetical protein